MVFDDIRDKVLADRSQFFQDFTMQFYGANRERSKESQSLRDSFWRQGMQARLNNVVDCIKAFSVTDFTEDLKKCDVRTLVLHGDDDQIVPIAASALAVLEADHEGGTEGLQGWVTRFMLHPKGPGQRGCAGIVEGLKEEV